MLTGRDYTTARIRDKLAARGAAGEEIETVLLQLQREGWLDDRRYAERFAESAVSSGRYYGGRLRMEMRRRGFSPDLITETVSPLLDETDEVAEVRSAVESRYPGFTYSAACDRDKRRVIGFLQRRGYSFAAIMRALRDDG